MTIGLNHKSGFQAASAIWERKESSLPMNRKELNRRLQYFKCSPGQALLNNLVKKS